MWEGTYLCCFQGDCDTCSLSLSAGKALENTSYSGGRCVCGATELFVTRSWITPGAGNDAPRKEHSGTVPSAGLGKGAAAIVTAHHPLERIQGKHCQDESLACLLEHARGGCSLSRFCYLSLFFATEAVTVQARDRTPE